MRVRVLGPLEVYDGDQWRQISAPKQRALLVALLLRLGEPVSADQLAEELWANRPPRQAANLIHGYACAVRRALGDHDATVLRSRSPGYRLLLDRRESDAGRFEDLVHQGQAARRIGDLEAALALLREALSQWRGAAFVDVPQSVVVRAEADRLEELRLSALETTLDIELHRGQDAELVPELYRLTTKHPLREQLWVLYMLALYRSGRQSEALEAYQRLHRLLDDELGVRPGQAARQLQQRILDNDPELDRPAPEAPTVAPAEPAGVPVPRQLPGDIGDFTGRTDSLERLDALLAGAAEAKTVLVAVVTGAGGVGKTTFAVHWAHRHSEAFPDGQLYLDLRGYAPTQPLPPIDALTQFLRALGADPAGIPVELDEASGLYRSLLTGKRVLILLDNAIDAGHVRPLLPGTPTCAVLVTSRDRLAGLLARNGAQRVPLDRLGRDEASDLLTRILGPQRISDEPAAAAQLARLCDGYPLALRLAATNLAEDPDRPIADYVRDLQNAPALDHLRMVDDPAEAMTGVFEHSYQRLEPEQRRLFRLLSLIPGSDFTGDAAAALAGVSDQDAASGLAGLVAGSLLERRGSFRGGRYAFHDLLRQFAAVRCEQAESAVDRSSAVTRLLDWYTATAINAARRAGPEFARLPETNQHDVSGLPFDQADDAMAWLEAERANLLAIVAEAADQGHRGGWLIADALRGYFLLRRHTGEWLALTRDGLRAASLQQEPSGQAACEISLAQAGRCLGDFDAARSHGERALQHCRAVGWTQGEVEVIGELIAVQGELGDAHGLIASGQQALQIPHMRGDPGEYGNLLTTLGFAYLMTGQLRQALEHAERGHQLLLRKSLGEHNEAVLLANLAVIHRLLGEPENARTHAARSLDIQRGLDYRPGIALALDSLARLDLDAGRHHEALTRAEEALAMARSAGSPRLEARMLSTRGIARLQLSDFHRALADQRQAMRLAAATRNRYHEVDYRIALAENLQALGDLDAAHAETMEAVQTAHERGYRLYEGRARTLLARLHHERGETEAARDQAEQAAALLRFCDSRPALAEALRLLGDIAEHGGAPDQSRRYRRQAFDIYATTSKPGAP